MAMRTSVTALVVATLLTVARPAHAKCTISATTVLFGAYNVFDAGAVDSTGTVSFTCDNKDKNIRITLDRGGEATFSRALRSGGNLLAYNLYLDVPRSVVWGDGTGGSSMYQDKNPPNNQQVHLTVYGRIPAGQDVSVGTYSDSIVATIVF